jgi:hypothetical protein
MGLGPGIGLRLGTGLRLGLGLDREQHVVRVDIHPQLGRMGVRLPLPQHAIVALGQLDLQGGGEWLGIGGEGRGREGGGRGVGGGGLMDGGW